MPNNTQNLRVAALDVGSNSVRLLVADARGDLLLPVFRDKISSRLYAGLADGLLHPDSIERTARAIESPSLKARDLGASRIWAFGTSAMRDGRNSAPLIERARRIDVALEVLSGEREALLSYAGAAPEGRAGIIDIGGGSTELLCGRDGRVLVSASAQMGAVRLYEFINGMEEPERMIEVAVAALGASYEAVKPIEVSAWIGLGGTINTLAAMLLQLSVYDPERIERQRIPCDQARDWLWTLCRMPLERRKRLAGMNPQRADIMPSGLAILCAFFSLSGVGAVYASDRDNLLGYLRQNLNFTQ